MKKPRYTFEKDGYWTWRTTKTMKKAGLSSEALGRDRFAAFQRAEQLNVEWDKVRKAKEKKEVVLDVKNGSFSWLVDRFQKDPVVYGSKAKRTQEEMNYAFKILSETFSDIPVRVIDHADCKLYYNNCRVRDGFSAHKTRKVFKWFTRALRYAKSIGVITIVPTDDLEMETVLSRRGRGVGIWSSDEIDRLVETALTGGVAKSGNEIPPRPSIAISIRIAYETSLPAQDIIALTWQQWDGVGFEVKQIKKRGDRRIYTPLRKSTAVMIEQRRKGIRPHPGQNIIINEETGKPYPDRTIFGRIFRKVRKRAGVRTDLTFQDIRRTALTEMGNMSATNTELSSFSGHAIGSKVLDDYVAPDKKAALQAARKRWGNDEVQ